MEYFVTGGTGFIGTNVVERLVDGGHDVIALTRDRANAGHLPDAVEVVEGDILEPDTLRDPMDGVDGVFHMAAWYNIGPGPTHADRVEAINVEGTRNVLEVMDDLGVPKGVYTSTIAVFGDTGSDPVDEDHDPDPPGISVYHETKWRAHYEVAEPMLDDGLPLVIIHPGAVLGIGDRPNSPTRRVFIDWLDGDLPMLPSRFYHPFDFVDEVVEGHVAAMDRGEPGESYITAREARNLTDIIERAADYVGRPMPRRVSPMWFSLLAAVLKPTEWLKRPPSGLEPEMMRLLGRIETRVDNSKAREELGLEYGDFEEKLYEYLDWELEQQGIERVAG